MAVVSLPPRPGRRRLSYPSSRLSRIRVNSVMLVLKASDAASAFTDLNTQSQHDQLWSGNINRSHGEWWVHGECVQNINSFFFPHSEVAFIEIRKAVCDYLADFIHAHTEAHIHIVSQPRGWPSSRHSICQPSDLWAKTQLSMQM